MNKEYLKLKKIDEWIARHVFKYKVVDQASLSASDGLTYYERSSGCVARWEDDQGPCHVSWSPTTDANDAWGVFAALLKRVDVCIRYDKPGHLGAGKDGRYVAGIACHDGVDWELDDTGSPGLSITICLMAKKVFNKRQ
jgi:hypothetical protein